MSIKQQVALARAEAKRRSSSVQFIRAVDHLLGTVRKIRIIIFVAGIGWIAIFFMMVGIMTTVATISEILKAR